MSDDESLSNDLAVSVKRVPDVAEPLLGFRSWVWDGAHKTLTSVAKSGTSWPPGKDMHAECAHGRHPAADPKCTCGIYATADIATAAQYTGVGNCFGLIYGWGDHVVPTDNGFRAEFARIAAIFAVVREVSMDAPDPRRIARLYGVPLLVPHSLNVEDYRVLLSHGAADIDTEYEKLLEEGEQ